MLKSVILAAIFGVTSAVLAQEVRSYGFEDIIFGRCNNSCVLVPDVGPPFKLEYRVVKSEAEGGLMSESAELILNGKKFILSGTGSWGDSPISFTQYLFFDNHRFQMYKITSSVHTRTSLHYYFIRKGNEFYLLTPEPVPTLSYDYGATIGKKDNEKFFGVVGEGGYNFDGSLEKGPSYTRVFFRLEENRLVEAGSERY